MGPRSYDSRRAALDALERRKVVEILGVRSQAEIDLELGLKA